MKSILFSTLLTAISAQAVEPTVFCPSPLVAACVSRETPPPPPPPVPVPTPPPSGGVVISPSDSLQAAVDKGGTVVLKDGEYKGPVRIKKDGVTLVAQNAGKAVIKADSGDNLIIDASNVTVRGLVLRGGGVSGKESHHNHLAANRVERAREEILLEDLTIEKARGVGLALNGDKITARRLVARDNGAAGIGGSHGEEILLEDSKIFGNNLIEKRSDGGGGKFTRTDRVVLRRVEAYGNVGPGIWFDIWNTNTTIEDCYSHDNLGTSNIHGKGIMLELHGGDKSGKLSGKSRLIRNRVENNDVVSGRSKDHQRGFNISSAAGIEMIDNIVAGGDTLNLKDASGREIKTQDITIRGTKFLSGGRINWDGASKSCCKIEE